MSSMLKSIQLPELPDLEGALRLIRTDRPQVAGALLAAVATAILGQGALRYLQRRKKTLRARDAHVARIKAWKGDHERNVKLREAEGEQSAFEADTATAYTLWQRGTQLGCPPEVLKDVTDILANTMVEGMKECLEQRKTNWSYRQRLLDMAKKAEEMGMSGFFGTLWPEVNAAQKAIWVENYRMLLRVVRQSAGSRLCRVAITIGVAYFTDAVSSVSSEAYDSWTEFCQGDGPFGAMLTFASHYLFISMLEGFVDTMGARITKYLSSSFKKEVDRTLYMNLVRQDTAFFDNHTAEEIEQLSNITEDLQDADERLHRTIRQVVRCVLRTKSLFLTDARMFASTIGVYATSQYATRLSTQFMELFATDPEHTGDNSTLSGLCRELRFIMDHIKLLRVNGRVNELVNALVQRRASEDDDLENQYSVAQRLVDSASTFALSAIRCFGLWFGAVTVAARNLEDVSVETYLSQTFILCGEWGSLDFSWIPLYAANTATMLHMLESKPNIERDGGLVPAVLRGKVEFRNVHFAYPSRPDLVVLKGVSFVVQAGQTAAFVGKSGSGKSTCMCLLQRLYAPTSGQILVDDRPIEEYDTCWLRGQIGVVLQESTLFDMTVEENIKLGNPQATGEEVLAASKAASAYEFIVALPSGLQTKLGHGSVNLSGGQKQRLNIARALVKRPALMLLDEFTSALDNVCEANVVGALTELMQGKTVISIAHRLGAISSVDCVFVFAKGNIVERGTIPELQALGGLFAMLNEPTKRNASFGGSPDKQGSFASSFSGSFTRQESITGFEEEPAKPTGPVPGSVDPASVRGLLDSWEEAMKWMHELTLHPDVQASLALRSHVRTGHSKLDRAWSAKRDRLPEECKAPVVAVDFTKQFGTKGPSKWDKVRNMKKALSLSRSLGGLAKLRKSSESGTPTSTGGSPATFEKPTK